MMQSFRAILFLSLSFWVALSANAITDQERAELQRLHNELSSLSSIIDAAKRSSNEKDRQQVNYSQLKKDLDTILSGIDDAINSVRREPRVLTPIKGAYN